MREADALGVNATPTMYVNGEKTDVALPVKELRAIFDRALQQAGVAVPAHPVAVPAAQTGAPK